MSNLLLNLVCLAQAQAPDPFRSNLPQWVTPLWILCLGVLAGLLIALVIYGIAKLASPETGAIIEEVALSGLLKPVFYISLVLSAIALLLAPFGPVREVLGPLWPRFWQPQEPPGVLLVGTAVSFLALVLFALLLRMAFPKVAAVALTTAKEGVAQPLFWVLIIGGGFVLLTNIWWAYNTFGEDIKMLKQQGLEMLMAIALLLTVVTASVSVAQEIEGRTALTVLSKPIGRRQFIIGKFLGVVAPVFLMFLVLGLVFLGTVSYKVVYESFETGQGGNATVADCGASMMVTIPGLVLKFIGATCMAAISVAISTRLPMVANLAICFVIYAVGHLMPLLVQSAVGRFEVVQFMGQLIATVVPVLENFDVQAAIAGDKPVPAIYLVNAAVYGLVYCLFMLCGALFLFEDRDLA